MLLFSKDLGPFITLPHPNLKLGIKPRSSYEIKSNINILQLVSLKKMKLISATSRNLLSELLQNISTKTILWSYENF